MIKNFKSAALLLAPCLLSQVRPHFTCISTYQSIIARQGVSGQKTCKELATNSPVYASGGKIYTVGCGKDLAGIGDIKGQAATSYEQCFAYCSNTQNCQAFTWHVGWCWLKNYVAGAKPADSLDANQQPVKDMGWIEGTYSNTRSCVQLGSDSQYVDDRGKKYTLRCAKDLVWQGDIANYAAPAFESCFALCSQNKQCTAFAFNSNQKRCWLKAISRADANTSSSGDA